MRRIKLAAAAFTIFIAAGICACSPIRHSSKTDNEPQLIIGSDIYAPYFYIADDGDFTGIDVDIARDACKRMNMEPVFKNINWQNKDICLADSDVDCLWGSFSMTGREELYDWAGPYLKSRQVVIVKASSGIYQLSDLNGKDIAVQNASKPEELFLHGGVENVQNPGRIYSFSTFNNVFAALKKGYVEACAGHEVAYGELIAASQGEYRILDEPLLKVELGVAFYKGRNPQLAQKLTKTLHEMRADGTLTTIVEQYGLDSSAVIGE